MEAETVYSDYPLPRVLDRDRYAGKWIAIRGDDVAASADSLGALLEDERVSRDDTLYKVPEEPGVPFLQTTRLTVPYLPLEGPVLSLGVLADRPDTFRPPIVIAAVVDSGAHQTTFPLASARALGIADHELLPHPPVDGA